MFTGCVILSVVELSSDSPPDVWLKRVCWLLLSIICRSLLFGWLNKNFWYVGCYVVVMVLTCSFGFLSVDDSFGSVLLYGSGVGEISVCRLWDGCCLRFWSVTLARGIALVSDNEVASGTMMLASSGSVTSSIEISLVAEYSSSWLGSSDPFVWCKATSSYWSCWVFSST